MRIFTAIKSALFFFALATAVACAGSGGFGVYLNTNQLAVDSGNDRLFLSQSGGTLFALTASTRVALAAQPIVSEDANVAISDLLPRIVTNFGAYANGTASRLFIMGALSAGDELVTNRIRVLDFDGTTFTEAAFSPIVISDGDDATDESDDSFADLVVDQAENVFYVTDTNVGLLFTFNATDGSAIAVPTPIAGNPQGMALDNGRLYVCNSSEVAAEQVVTVINTADATATAIDLDIPCDHISVATNSSGTALIAKDSSHQHALIRTVDTATYADSAAIAATTAGFAAGEITSGSGISSGLNDVVLTRDSAELLQGYLSEEDGNIELFTITADLASYSAQTISVASLNLGEGGVLTSGSTGEVVFFVSESGALASVAAGSVDVDLDD